jgi:hypothetical protein
MLRAGDPDRGLLGMVVSNLRSMLQSDADADVEALALELGDTKHVFEFPPMLRASWRLILKHAEARPEIVPVNGLSARVASQTVISDFWLVWRGGDRAEELEYEREMVKHLQVRAQALFKREEEWRSGAARTSPARSLISLATPMPDNDSVPGVPIVGHDERTVGASWIPKSRLLKLSEDPGDLE